MTVHQASAGASCPCKKLPYYLSSFTAAEHGDVHSLFRHGAEALRKRQDVASGMTPLHLAAQHGHVAATAALLAAGCDVNGRSTEAFEESASESSNMQELGQARKNNNKRATPLHRASFSGAVATIHLLLQEASCDLLAPDSSFGDFMTPLHKAVSGGRHLAVQLLLQAHASRQSLRPALSATDAAGCTPLQLARQLLLCPDQAPRVARWDAVAGTAPDWERCAQLLEQAQPPPPINMSTPPPLQCIAISAEQQPQPPLLAKPPPMARLACLDCGPDGVCATAAWEQSLWRALSLQADAAATSDPANNNNAPSRVQQASPKGVEPAAVVETATNGGGEVVGEAPSSSSMGANQEPAAEGNDIGAICGNCGKRTIALYPTEQGGAVCKKCRKRVKKQRL